MEWKDRFSATVRDRLEESAISVVMREAARQGALMLSAGEPMAELYPEKELRESFQKVLAEGRVKWGYTPHRRGVPDLLRWIVEWMGRDGLLPGWVTPGDLLVTNGSQEGMSLLSECLLDPGDRVMVESPSYPDAMGVFRRDGVLLEGVDLLPDGPDIEAMERLLAEKKVKAFYTIPTYQNPTGFSTSDEKKERVLELARRHDFVIFEDDPYRNITFEKKPRGTYIRASGDDRRVIYLGSFSKVIAPGLRLGWMIAPSPVDMALEKLRIAGTLCLPDVIQYAIRDLVDAGGLQKHLAKVRPLYKANRDALAASLVKHAGLEGLEVDVPGGGFFIWGRIPWLKDAQAFAMEAIKNEKVAVVPGAHFYPEPGRGGDRIRFAFAAVKPDQAEEGALRLARALKLYRAGRGGEK